MLGALNVGLHLGWVNCSFAGGGRLRSWRGNGRISRRECAARRRNVEPVRNEMGGEYEENYDDVTKVSQGSKDIEI